MPPGAHAAPRVTLCQQHAAVFMPGACPVCSSILPHVHHVPLFAVWLALCARLCSPVIVCAMVMACALPVAIYSARSMLLFWWSFRLRLLMLASSPHAPLALMVSPAPCQLCAHIAPEALQLCAPGCDMCQLCALAPDHQHGSSHAFMFASFLPCLLMPCTLSHIAARFGSTASTLQAPHAHIVLT